jgi:lipoprotein NlpI
MLMGGSMRFLCRTSVGMLLLAAVGAANAAGYDDFAKGVSAESAGKLDVALAAYTAALDAGDLAPTYVPTAHFNRARIYMQKKMCVAAFDDLSAAIELRADYAQAYELRWAVDVCLKKSDLALADISSAITLAPEDRLYDIRAFQYWKAENYAAAAADHLAGEKLHKGSATRLLWYAIAAKHAGSFDPAVFVGEASKLDSDWIYLAVKLFLGKTSPEEVLAAAAKEKDNKPNLCKAGFFIAEWHLGRGEMDQAEKGFRDTLSACPVSRVEYMAANIELKHLPQP